MSSDLIPTNKRLAKADGSALTSAGGFQAGKGRINSIFCSGETLRVFQQNVTASVYGGDYGMSCLELPLRAVATFVSDYLSEEVMRHPPGDAKGVRGDRHVYPLRPAKQVTV